MQTAYLPRLSFFIAALTLLSAATAIAATVLVSALGEHGWASGDTRAAGYLDIHGDTQVVSGRNATEDALIADRLAFVAAPGNPPLGSGALRLMIDGVEDKATLALSDLSDPFAANVNFEYAWFVAGNGMPTMAAPSIKIGIDTTEANGSSDLAVDRGEEGFDKILIYEPYFNGPKPDDTWTPEVITPATGDWWLVNLNPASPLPPGGIGDLRTLDQWVIDFAAAGLAGATITSIQVGVGSGNPAQESYVDYVTYMNSGQGTSTTWNFEAPASQVPSSTGLIHIVLSALLVLLGVGMLTWPHSYTM